MSPGEEAGARLRRLRRDLEADVEAMERRVGEIATVVGMGDDPATSARLAVAIHHYYTSFEAAVERAIRFFDGDVPSGAEWHRALLAEAVRPLPGVRPALVSPDSIGDWAELLRFRHFFRHAYAVELERPRLDDLAARVEKVHRGSRDDLGRVLEMVARAVGELDGGDE